MGQAYSEGHIAGAKWMAERFIARAVEWLCTHHPFDTKEQAELYAAAFKKAMEKEEE